MQETYPGINPSIADWKGQEISDFQEELLIKVNAHISEKWFYNHIKSDNKSLPRIDILNLLSKYVGYANWDDFIYKHVGKDIANKPIPNANRYFIFVPLLLIALMAILIVIFKLISIREYHFSFYDAYTKEPISSGPLEIIVLSEDESPMSYFSDANGNFVLETDESEINMVVSAPYYKSDTIFRVLKKFETKQNISLYSDDYALIIHYFSVMSVNDWQQRRLFLNKIIDEDAMIYQVLNNLNSPGMELYNKSEFIDKLTMPTGSLKSIEVLDTKFKNDKIMVLRFRINEKTDG